MARTPDTPTARWSDWQLYRKWSLSNMAMEIGSKTRLLLAASFLGTAAESMLVPIYVPLAHRAGGSIIDTGIGLALFSITTGIFVTTVGVTQWFHNNIRKLLVVGFLLAGIADLGYIFVE